MQTTNQEIQKLTGNVFPVIGAGLLLAAIVSAISTHRFVDDALRAEGRVVRLTAGGAHPVIQFVPSGKAAVEFPGNGFIKYAVGDKVTVLYLEDAQSPSGFRTNIDTPGALWFTAFILTWIDGGFILGGLYTQREYDSQQ